jgi:hypothetical protein
MNKNEWDNSLLEHFAPKKGGLNLDLLMEMVAEVMDSGVSLITEAEGEKLSEDFMRFLPKFEMSEKVGELPDEGSRNEARDTFTKYLNAVIASSPGLPGKIDYINKFTTGEAAGTASISEILSNLTFLKILAFVVTQFSPSGSGFLFEAFLAALLGGTQITAREQGGALPIDDYREMVDPETGEGGVPVSLKLLSPGSSIDGSTYNLIDFIRRSDVAMSYGGIKYVVTIKTTDNKLEFYKFDIKPEQLFYWIKPAFFDWGVISNAMQQYLGAQQGLQEAQGRETEEQFQEFKEFWASISPAWGQYTDEQAVSAPIADFSKKYFKFTMRKNNMPQIIEAASSQGGFDAWNRLRSVAEIPEEKAEKLSDEVFASLVERYNSGEEGIDHKTITNLLGARRLLAIQYTEKVSGDHPHSYYAMAAYLQGAKVKAGPKVKDMKTKDMISKLNDLVSSGDLETWGKILIGEVGGTRETDRLKEKQFSISQKFLRSGGGVRMGTIITDPKQIKSTLDLYSGQLKELVYPIYKEMFEMTEKINEYFIEGKINAGQQASNHANTLAGLSEKLVPEK